MVGFVAKLQQLARRMQYANFAYTLQAKNAADEATDRCVRTLAGRCRDLNRDRGYVRKISDNTKRT